MSEARERAKQHLITLAQEQCDLLLRINSLVQMQQKAILAEDFEGFKSLSDEIEPITRSLEDLQHPAADAEKQLVDLYAGLDIEKHRAEMSEVLALVSQRNAGMQVLAEQQANIVLSLETYVDILTKEGRDLNQTLSAFHGYRKAANLDTTLLNVRK